MSIDISEPAAANAGQWDVDAFKSQFANLTIEDKRLVLYWLVHDLMGDRPEKETDVSDPEGFVYMHFVPPGIRAYLWYLEHPEKRQMLEESSKGPFFPHEEVQAEIWKELGITAIDLDLLDQASLMVPPYKLIDNKATRDQLAQLYLKYRRLRAVAAADVKIGKALRLNPQGGMPVVGTNRWTITVHPLFVTYEIVGDEVRIVSYEDTHGP